MTHTPTARAPVTERGIYIASKAKPEHAERWRQVAKYYPVNSTWIYEAGQGESQDIADLWRRCVHEAATASAIVVYREAGEVLRGAWVEMGAALAHGVPVFAVGLEDQGTIARDPRIQHFRTFKEAFTDALANPHAAERDAPGGVVVPEGWKLVPVAMTPKMMEPLGYYLRDKWFLQGHSLAVNEFWNSALAAAPPPPANIGGDSPSEREKALREAIQCCENAKICAEAHYGVAESVGADMAMRRIMQKLATPAEGGGK